MKFHWMGLLIAGAGGTMLTLLVGLLPWLNALRPWFGFTGWIDQATLLLSRFVDEWACLVFIAPFWLGAAIGAAYGFLATRQAEPPTTGGLALGGAFSAALAGIGSGVLAFVVVYALIIVVGDNTPPAGVDSDSLGEMIILIAVLAPAWALVAPVLMAGPGAGGAVMFSRKQASQTPPAPTV